jgi:aerobic carbon-monoxide dehydrogenase large subunit
MSGHGIGACVARKEDDRFLRGRGQYVADFQVPGAREVAFVRSSVAHGRIRHVRIPDAHKNAVFTAKDLADVRPVQAATALSGFKHSSEPILALDKVRYVGELVVASPSFPTAALRAAACAWRSKSSWMRSPEQPVSNLTRCG